jgi:hypothetical protein
MLGWLVKVRFMLGLLITPSGYAAQEPGDIVCPGYHCTLRSLVRDW